MRMYRVEQKIFTALVDCESVLLGYGATVLVEGLVQLASFL